MSEKKKLCKCCNQPMPKKAKKCPSCGVKNKSGFLGKVILAIVVILIIYAAVNVEKKDKNEEPSTEIEFTIPQKTETAKSEETASTVDEKDTEAVTETEQTTEPETNPAENLVDGIRPEFKKAMDDYEAFMNEYCDFMILYNNSEGLTPEMIIEYGEYIEKYAQTTESLKEIESQEMNEFETMYYAEVTARVSKRMLEISTEIQ